MTALLDRLPKQAKRKLIAIEDASQEAQTMVFNIGRRLADARSAVNDSAGRDAEEIGAAIAKMTDAQARHQERHRALAQFCAQAKHYLQNLPPSIVLEDAPSVKAPLLRNETFLRAVERIRNEITATQAEQTAVMHAALPAADLKAAAREYVFDLAERGRPTIRADHDGFSVAFPARGQGFAPSSDLAAALAWMNEGTLLRRLCSEIDRAQALVPKDALILSKQARADRLDALTDRLWQLERDEEALIEAAGDDGHEITRRGFASPAAVLGVKVKRQGAASAAA